VLLDEAPSSSSGGLTLPSRQYERLLIRRAVRKEPSETEPGAFLVEPSSSSSPFAEPCGDVSLGMKLTVVAGRVVVQSVQSLRDGRASPAQLAGSIQRGDVLLSINDQSLVNLPVDLLMRGLQPLSTPNADGVYAQTLKLRFVIGEGLALLEKTDAAKEAAMEASQQADAANEMFSLFPMVDQLGGFHYGDSNSSILLPPFATEHETTHATAAEPATSSEATASATTTSNHTLSHNRKKRTPLEQIIAQDLAKDRLQEKQHWKSDFYHATLEVSDLLRPPSPNKQLQQQLEQEDTDADSHADSMTRAHQLLTLSQLLERGKRALVGAKALSDRVEVMDGSSLTDVRSFQSWTSTLSLYSRASARRKLVFDGTSLPINFGRLDEVDQEESSNDENDNDSHDEDKSNGSGEPNLDADELLLQMAAHDEVWRKQVTDFLEKVNEQLQLDSSAAPETATLKTTSQSVNKEHKETDMDTILSNELGSFLFGENMSKIIKKEKTSLALPPADVTSVLFDLTTKISASIPNEVTAAGSYRSNMTPSVIRKMPAIGSEVSLASQFLLEELLPRWLKSFQPLPWEHRRMLWPLNKSNFGGSTTASSTLSDESISVDSMSTSQKSLSFMPRKRKNLRERIEEQELNVETRTETCFLATFYFTQHMLTQYRNGSILEDDIRAFIKAYGSYLSLHACITLAAEFQADRIIKSLLEVAQQDPRHKEVTKQLSKATCLVFYEPSMLSAVLHLLYNIHNPLMRERRISIVDLCVSSFPDIRPWQVKKACNISDGDGNSFADPSQMEFDDLYYVYLSQLLHPTEGHDAARHDPSLVEEWCKLSIHQVDNGTLDDRSFDRMANFLSVASTDSSRHLAFHRDLELLLGLAMEIKQHDLALEIAVEIMQVARQTKSFGVVHVVLDYIRIIDIAALNIAPDDRDYAAASERLRKILSIYKSAAFLVGDVCNLPEELYRWISHLSFSSQRMLELIHFLSQSDEAAPADLLSAFLLWTESFNPPTTSSILPSIRTILSRAANDSMGCELSSSLLQLRRARHQFTADKSDTVAGNDNSTSSGPSIWSRMACGKIKIAK
jgi:hypothetical protein